ncbi:MAG: DUF4430 domain-containing protein [Clostridia bacterium]|nr:DUF4430 domain-containing protein [Clostridia bacterium]
MKKTLRILALVLALILATFAFAACGGQDASTDNTDVSTVSGTEKPEAAQISITVKVVDDKGETTDFPIKTSEKFLRGALEQENLVEGEDGPYGLYIKKVNGISADYETDGAYWSVYEGETAAMTGVDQIELKDGGVYKLVYTKA